MASSKYLVHRPSSVQDRSLCHFGGVGCHFGVGTLSFGEEGRVIWGLCHLEGGGARKEGGEEVCDGLLLVIDAMISAC